MKLEVKLDAKTIASLTLPAGKLDEIFWDGELPGFGYRLRRLGDRVEDSYVVQYRSGGRTRRPTLSAALLPHEARLAARKLLAGVTLGADPQGEREAKRRMEAQTFHAIAALSLDARASELRPASFRVAKLYLTGSYFRPLHPVAINEIGHADVAACIRRIENAHSACTAGAARRAVSAFFAWAIAEGLRAPPNPVIGTRRLHRRATACCRWPSYAPSGMSLAAIAMVIALCAC